MNKIMIMTMAVVACAMATEAAALRRLQPITVSEGASVEFSAESAVSLKSSNSAIASVTPPDGGRATVAGLRLGTAELVYSDVKGPTAVRPVTVVPSYWETLVRFFEEDPEITVSVSGDKVIIAGKTASPETLGHISQAKLLDPNRIISQVTYSMSAIGSLLGQYLSQIGYSNVTVSVVGTDVCLKGHLFDKPSIKLVDERARQFVDVFNKAADTTSPIGVNSDGLKIYKQKIVLEVEMLEYDVNEARNLGIKWPSAITAVGNFTYGWDISRDATANGSQNAKSDYSGSRTWNQTANSSSASAPGEGGKTESTWGKSLTDTLTSALTGSSSGGNANDSSVKNVNNWKANSSVAINNVQMTVNLLKENGVTKTLYKTSLATQSGEEAQFQNGGTIHRSTYGNFSSGDLKTIEYGFIIKALPLIVDPQTVNLTLDLDNKTPLNYNPSAASMEGRQADINVVRYQTKSKYMVRPGETIVMSGFNKIDETDTKQGLPWLSQIPWIGKWFFGNTETKNSTTEMLLVVKIDWALENASEEAVRQRDALKGRKAEVEMP